jgi:NADPH:quinone reductase-like Zn-dependent oxidoreductase
MKASYIEEQGGPEVMKFGELPDPSAGPGEIVIDVHAASINGADWKVRAGSYSKLTTFPYVLGRDFSGVISALGDGVTFWQAGDPVFGVCDVGQEGAHAEKLTMKESLVAPKPDGLSHAAAAALALTGLTALVSVEDTLALASGERILIQGGAGGVASFAIQLAKHLGAYVITTTSTGNMDYVRGFGPDEVIDYKTEDFAETVSDCDAVFETVGGDVAMRSFSVLKPGGRAAFIASGMAAPEPTRDDVTSLRPAVGRDRAHLERIVELVAAGAIQPPEITRFALSDAAAALALSESRHFRGKLVLEMT